MTKTTRRRFLEDSLLAAAALAVTPAARSWAAEQPAPASANGKLGVAVIGTRGRGKEHIAALLARPDVEILYLVDCDENVGQTRADEIAKGSVEIVKGSASQARLDEIAKGLRRPKVVKDMRTVFDDKSVDLVTVATPNHWHSLAAIWAMQAGKDVYLEKPVSHNVSEGRRVVEAAEKYQRICQAGTQSRSMQAVCDMIRYLHDGKLGEVKLARGLCYKPRGPIGPKGTYQVPKEVDYDLWSGPAPMAPLTRRQFHYDWHWQWLWGNGDLGNQGIHQMDIARWGLGITGLCDRVLSYGGRLGYEDAGETPNSQVILQEFGPDKTILFEVRGLKTDAYQGSKVGVIFHGSEGYLVIPSGYTTGAAFDKKGNLIQSFEGGDRYAHFHNFLDAVHSRKREDLHGPILEGHLSSALCHLGNISYRLGKEASYDDVRQQLAQWKTHDDPEATFERFSEHLLANDVEEDKTMLTLGAALTFDPSSETFPDNAAANALLTREYRAPYVVPVAGQV